MPAPSDECPSPDALLDLVEGRLHADEADALRCHLDRCEGCVTAVAGLLASSGARPEPEVAIDWSGTRVAGRYAVRAVLGRGATAVVYEAWDEMLERVVALKTLGAVGSTGPSPLRERLLAESKILARLEHAHVVAVHDVLVDAGTVFIAMERVDGPTLRGWVETGPDLDARIRVLREAAEGLRAAHGVGLVHRDFKPDNVLVTAHGRARVADFGLARVVDVPWQRTLDGRGAGKDAPSVELTATGAVVGTPMYMAPEQFSGGEVDARSDVFAFCVTAYEVLAGRRPYAGGTAEAVHAAKLDAAFDPLPTALPRAVREVVAAGLHPDPQRRPGSMQAVVDAFTVGRRRRRGWLVLGAVAVAGVGLWGVTARDTPTSCAARSPGRVVAGPLRMATLQTRDPGSWPEAAEGLRAYTRAFEQAWSDACGQAEDDGRLARACLSAQAARVDASLRAAMVGEVSLTSAHRRLPDPASCHGGLGALIPAPPPALAAAVGELRVRLDAADEAVRAGSFDDAVPAIERIVAEARALGHPPLLADALFLQGFATSFRGDSARARGPFIEAARVGVSCGHNFTAARAWLQLMDVELVDGSTDFARAAEYAELARGAIEALGEVPVARSLRYDLALNVGQRHLYADELDEAQLQFEQALALAESGDPVARANALEGIGLVQRSRGQADAAERTQRDVLAQRLTVYGPEHVSVLAARYNVAVDAMTAGRHDVAMAEVEQARVLAEALRPDGMDLHADVLAVRLNLLGQTGAELGAIVAAADELRAVLAVSPRGDTMARAMMEAELAEQLYRMDATAQAAEAGARALVAADQLRPDNLLSLSSRATLVHVLLDLGRVAEARARADEMVAREALWARVREGSPLVSAYACEAVARAYAEAGELDRAAPLYREAIAGFESAEGYAINGLLARIRWAETLWDAGQKPQSRAEAVEAWARLDAFESDEDRAAFVRWATRRGIRPR